MSEVKGEQIRKSLRRDAYEISSWALWCVTEDFRHRGYLQYKMTGTMENGLEEVET